MLEFFIESFFRGICYLIIAAITGWVYLRKVPDVPFYKKFFIYYLWVILLVDLLGYYVAVAYYTDYRVFGFIKDTVLERNYWLFNAAYPLTFIPYLWFFVAQLKSKDLQRWFKIGAGLYLILAVVFNITSGDYFTSYVSFHLIAGSILLAISIASYFIQILNSDQIINFYKTLSFYVGVGALLWHLGYTPLYILNRYNIMESSPDFLEVYKIMLSIFNLLLYSCFTIGFLVEMRHFKKSRATINF